MGACGSKPCGTRGIDIAGVSRRHGWTKLTLIVHTGERRNIGHSHVEPVLIFCYTAVRFQRYSPSIGQRLLADIF